MATLALSLAGQFAGALVGGPIGATIGRALGALAGSAVDGWLFGQDSEAPSFDVRLGGSSEGAAISRLYGWGRLSGNIIWARELERLGGENSGAKGFGHAQEQDEVGASFAIGFCEGKVARLGRIWADGQLLDTRGLNFRFYNGDENQLADSLIEATQGSGKAPAYRGLCYLVFENLPLSRFGNRIPQITAELCRAVGELEPAIRAVTVIPGATEFGYDPAPRLRVLGPGQGVSENAHLLAGTSDWTCSLDELHDLCPNLEHVALVVSWFGDDLRCGQCAISPRVEAAARSVGGVNWSVAGLGRGEVPVVSTHAGGPAYGGTPSDAAVLAAIADLKGRGLKVTLYPLMLMDVPEGNSLPDPYGGAGQGAYPWRGRITCHPAPGRAGSPVGSAAVRAQVADFAGGYRVMVLHYAHLAAEAGGIDALLIGSEMVGMSTIRAEGGSFPFVEALVALAGDVRAIAGAGTKLTYAADWSEYAGTGTGGEKFFHLDPLWAAPQIDAVGIDCYMPLGDWRDGENHLDLHLARSEYDLDYLAGNIAGGEGFDWFYASAAERRAQTRTPIEDGAHGEPWIWRYKDIRAFWSQHHYDRPDGVRAGQPTAWVPGSKPIWLTELGCGAVDKGANQPNIFGDEKSSEDGRPYFSSGRPDGLIQRQFLRAHHRYWRDTANNPPGMLDIGRIYCWTWDARPFPAFPAEADVWADGPNHRTGHWLTGRLAALASDELVDAIAADHGCALAAAPAAPMIGGLVLPGPGTAREAIEPVLGMTGQHIRARNGVLVAEVPMRGAAHGLDADRLAAIDGPIVSRRRGQAEERPSRLVLGHLDRERDYLAALATAIRPGTGPATSQATQAVLDGSAARLAAERMLDGRAGSTSRLDLAVPPNLLALEVGDCIALDAGGPPYEITEIRDGAVRRLTAQALPPGDALAVGVDRPMGRSGAPAPTVMPLIVAAHLPPLPDDPERTRLVLGAFASPWPGSLRVTDAATGASLAVLTRPAAIGTVLTGFAGGATGVWDRGTTIDLDLAYGHPADGADLAVLGGSNRLAVETDAGGWEVIGFAEAELVAPGRYRLRRLLRGLDGSEAAMRAIAAGNRAMVLDARVSTLPVETHFLGETRVLRCFAGTADASGQALAVPFDAAPGLPLAPAHMRTELRGDGAIALRWTRRSRADGGSWGVAEPALDYAPERYRVTISAAGSVLRVLDVPAPQASYGVAEQVADFGGPASGFAFAVAQISPLLGAGPAAEGSYHG